jgi:1-acyl-sn-glycerol-3-phosphate acyltransferase
MNGLIAVAVTWAGAVVLWRLMVLPALRRGPGDGDALTGLLWMVVRAFVFLVHRPRVRGMAELRRQHHPGPLVVVSNHTGPIDPFLIQSACRFLVRWMMASDLMYPALADLWRLAGIIPVARDGADLTAAREAIRHLRAGGVVGIFPEGRIAQPSGEIWPFVAGVGLLVARTRAPVLLVWVSQTPQKESILRSLITPSRARVEFLARLEFTGDEDAAEITARLRRALQEASGWRFNDHPPPLPRPPRPDVEPG